MIIRRQLYVCVIVAVVGALVDTPMAHSQKKNSAFRKEAERRNTTATEHYTQGRFEQSLQLYQAAYDLFPDPRFLFNIGLAHEKTFDYEACAITFAQYLKEANKASEKVRAQAEERLHACVDRAEIPVRLTSVPNNAAIFVGDGSKRELRGRTPLDLRLPPGPHVLSAEMGGYITGEQSIEITPGERPQLDFVLEKLSTLRVEVDPANAQISIDDLPAEPAPLVRQVAKGTHTVRVTKEGYESVTRDVSIEAGREVSLVLSLRASTQPRTLSIRSESVVAQVRVDGLSVGSTPLEYPLRPGQHQLHIMSPGRLPYKKTLSIPDDRDLLLQVQLQPQRSRVNRIAFWTLLGAAGSAGIIGSYFGVRALRDQSKFREAPSIPGSEAGERNARSADIWLAIGGLLGASAVGFHYLSAPEPSSAKLR